MYIDKELCGKCLDCRPVCPVGAIVLRNKEVEIDYETCVECGVCLRFEICPESAIQQVDEIPYPRIIRAIFSDPIQKHESTGVQGRGTEEMKTNDVTHHFEKGRIGFSIELGRPGVGAYLTDLEKVLMEVTRREAEFAEDNPVMQLIAERSTGALRPEILGEKVLSAIVEFTLPEAEALDSIEELKAFLNAELECVATMSVISRADESGESDFMRRLTERGVDIYPNGKVNIGMVPASAEAA
jgi:NAD-dependent dihydropyrimidine dehydrogenase PreA subunit